MPGPPAGFDNFYPLLHSHQPWPSHNLCSLNKLIWKLEEPKEEFWLVWIAGWVHVLYTVSLRCFTEELLCLISLLHGCIITKGSCRYWKGSLILLCPQFYCQLLSSQEPLSDLQAQFITPSFPLCYLLKQVMTNLQYRTDLIYTPLILQDNCMSLEVTPWWI